MTPRKVAGRLAVHGYTPKDGLPIEQLTDYLPELRRDQLIAAVRELEARAAFALCPADRASPR